jgi:hypothetical protein
MVADGIWDCGYGVNCVGGPVSVVRPKEFVLPLNTAPCAKLEYLPGNLRMRTYHTVYLPN